MTKKAKIIAGTSVIGVIVITAIIGVVIGTLNSNNNPSKYKSFKVPNKFLPIPEKKPTTWEYFPQDDSIPNDIFNKTSFHIIGKADFKYRTSYNSPYTKVKFTLNDNVNIINDPINKLTKEGLKVVPSDNKKIFFAFLIRKEISSKKNITKKIDLACINKIDPTVGSPAISYYSKPEILNLTIKY